MFKIQTHSFVIISLHGCSLVDAPPPPLQSQKDPAAVDKIMKDLDTNGDGQVDFEEFVSLVVGLSIACEQCYQTHLCKKTKK